MPRTPYPNTKRVDVVAITPEVDAALAAAEHTANLTELAIRLAKRASQLDIEVVALSGMAAAGISPEDGWQLNLTPGTPGYRQFTRPRAVGTDTEPDPLTLPPNEELNA